ncbi:MAG: cohesin domain-containing protein [Candidatus Poribacteria bacterium]|nr:cohesin domain-containing protein [Candidatus Poribacteria bacterium]
MSLCKKIPNFLKKNQETLLKHLFLLCLISIYSIFVTNALSQEDSPSDADSSLAEKVFEKYQTFLLREDIQDLLPTILEEIIKPENQKLLTPETINLVVDKPDLLKTFVPDIEDEFITLLKEDEEIQTFLRDTDVQALLQNPEAINELAALIELSQLSLVERIVERYQVFFQREDIMQLLPSILAEFKNLGQGHQVLLKPNLLKLVAENPDLLKAQLPQIDDEFIRLLKEDAEVKAFISDPDVQLLLLDPAAIDELAALLNIKFPVVVKIVPASVESPQAGEQLVITVDIADGQGVSGYEGTIQFDSTALRFVSLEHGSYLSGELLPISTKVSENQVSFAQISVDTPARLAEGTLVTITFDVLEAKASMLTLSGVIIGGFGGTSFSVITENTEILEPPKPWDVNNDGFVNILDLTFVALYFGKEDAPPEADVNGDGNVNILDLTLVANHFDE